MRIDRRLEHVDISATRVIDDVELPRGLNPCGILATHWFGIFTDIKSAKAQTTESAPTGERRVA